MIDHKARLRTPLGRAMIENTSHKRTFELNRHSNRTAIGAGAQLPRVVIEVRHKRRRSDRPRPTRRAHALRPRVLLLPRLEDDPFVVAPPPENESKILGLLA